MVKKNLVKIVLSLGFMVVSFLPTTVQAMNEAQSQEICQRLIQFSDFSDLDNFGDIRQIFADFQSYLTPEEKFKLTEKVITDLSTKLNSFFEVKARSFLQERRINLSGRLELVTDFQKLLADLGKQTDFSSLESAKKTILEQLVQEQVSWEQKNRVSDEIFWEEQVKTKPEEYKVQAKARQAALSTLETCFWYRGVVGPRGELPTSVTIHNTAGSQSAAYYRTWLLSGATCCAAHEYWDEKDVFHAEPLADKSWHCGASGNTTSIGLEICRDFGTDPKAFLTAEQRVIKRTAEILKHLGLPANEKTIIFHHEWSATECPWRTIQVHGKGNHWETPVKVRAKAWFVAEVQKVLSNQPLTPIDETLDGLAWPTYEESRAKLVRKQPY